MRFTINRFPRLAALALLLLCGAAAARAQNPQPAQTPKPQQDDPQGSEVINIREVRLAAGAEFVVMICGDIMTMPGLPKVPSAEVIRLNEAGQIEGLF